MATTARDPQGREWRVRRRWLARPLRRPAFLGDGRDGSDCGDSWWAELIPYPDLGDMVASIVLAIVVAVLVLVFAVLVWPLLVALVDAVYLLLAALLAVAGRVLLGRPWIVEARRIDGVGEPLEWRVTGWRRSRLAIGEIRTAIARGETAPQPPATGRDDAVSPTELPGSVR
jgi:hypothetical protein